MNKKLTVFLMIFTTIVLFGCNSDNESVTVSESVETKNVNLIDDENLIEGEWIDGAGDVKSNSKMYRTEKIEFNSEEDYILSRNAYVSSYKDDEFIETVRFQGGFADFPFDLEIGEDANQIVVSFSQKWLEEIEITKK